MRLALKDLPATERPLYRANNYGVASLSAAELMQLIVGCGYTDICPALLAKGETLMGLARMTAEEMAEIDGLGETGATRLKAAFELGRRLMFEGEPDRAQIKSPADCYNLLSDMALLNKEHFEVILLDSKNRVVRRETIYVGSLNTCVVRVGEVFKAAIKANAAAIILAHNHPSGDPTPSPEDVKVTGMIVQAGQLLDIKVLDHVIVGSNRFVSLKERGLGF